MAVAASSMSKELKAWSKSLEAYGSAHEEHQQLTQTLLQKVSELEIALHAERAEHQDQVGVKQKWRKRAEDLESRVVQSQFAAILIDGNNFVFRPEYMRTPGGAAVAVRALLAQARSFVKARHPSDIPESFEITIHVLADIERLSRALKEAGTISKQEDLLRFNRELVEAHEFLSIVDCGAGRNAELRVQKLYELYVENCHCRHLVLALDHDAEYFAVLHTYAEDETTLSKTSLLKPIHGLPNRYNLPFSIAEFSALDVVPLISFDNDHDHHSKPSSQVERSSVSDLQTLQIDVQPVKEHVPALEQTSPIKDDSNSSQKSNISQEKNSNSTDSAARAPSVASSNSMSAQIAAVPKYPKSQNAPHPVEPRAQPAGNGARYEPAPTYQTTVSSYMQDWESAPAENVYAPAADTTPWGADPTDWNQNSNWADSVNESANGLETAKQHHPQGNRREEKRNDLRSHAEWSARPPAPADRDKQVWRGVHSAAPRRGQDLSASKFGQSTPRAATMIPSAAIRSPVAINRLDQRIDVPLPSPSASDKAKFDLRANNKRLCNEHHIRHNCNNHKCNFDHQPIDEGVLLALRHTARRLPCSIGPECRRPDCFYGHHCPYEPCINRKCAFNARRMHEVEDLNIVKQITA